MDPLTHGLLGAATVQALYQKRYNQYPLWILGALIAMSPDLDIISSKFSDPLAFLIYHRHFTHALIFIPIAAIFFTALALLIWPSLRKISTAIFVALFSAYATHGLLDSCTSYGTLWYWPFLNTRVAWDCISIVDPIFTVILLLGVLFSVMHSSTLFARIALCLAIIYLGVGISQHQRAWQVMQQYADANNIEIKRGRVMPNLATLSHWHGLFQDGQSQIHLIEINVPLFQKGFVEPGPSFPKIEATQLNLRIQKNPQWMRDFKIFQWFSDDYVVAFQKHPLTVIDMRFLRSLTPPYVALWGIEFPRDDHIKHVVWRRNVTTDKTIESRSAGAN